MKKTLLSLMLAAVALLATNAAVQAGDSASQTVTPDWHYRWHEGRWWYWMPEGHWMFWNGSTWIPYQAAAGNADLSATRQVQPATASFAGYETEAQTSAAEPASSSAVIARPCRPATRATPARPREWAAIIPAMVGRGGQARPIATAPADGFERLQPNERLDTFIPRQSSAHACATLDSRWAGGWRGW